MKSYRSSDDAAGNQSAAGECNTGSFQMQSALFRGSVDCVKVLDLAGRLQLINPGGIVALELDHPEPLYGQLWWSLWPSPGNTRAEQAFRAAAQGKVDIFSAACPTALGSDRYWHVTASPILNTEGSVESVLVVSRDVTELTRMKAQLELALQRKDEILATVAHELRNPLSAAHSATHLLLMKESSPSDVARTALLIKRQLGHINRMVEDLVDSARVERGELSFTPARVDLNNVVRMAVEQVRPSAERKGQRITMTECDEHWYVMGDEVRLVQAVSNLVANAVRYTPEFGSIAVTVSHDGSLTEVVVADTGIGLSEGHLEALFDRFTRLQSDTSRSTGGLGLGLSLVKAIVSLHGGEVSAASAGPNKGSTFRIRL